MRDRAALILKVVCVGLAAWLAWELVRAGKDANPLAHVTIPDVPSLPADTNAPPAVANKPLTKPGTNMVVAGATTNGPALTDGTNAAPHKKAHASETNVTAIAVASTNNATETNISVVTNLVMNPSTNGDVTVVADTNAPLVATTNAAPSNSVPVTVVTSWQTNTSGSNVAVTISTNTVASGTNSAVAKASGSTNMVGDSARTNSTNSAVTKAPGARPPNAAAMAAMMGGPGGKTPAKLAPEIQARVDRVYESEIFAPIMHPMPMALLGIAGNVAFLRGPNGQTGLVKEGDNLGEIKLLRIGTNRVLVEQEGKKQELMIFSGFGGESLISKTNDSSNETTKH